MKRKSFGVAKWSTPGKRHELGVRQRIDERIGGTGEVAVAEHDEDRTRDLREAPVVERRARRLHERDERFGIVAGLACEPGEVLRGRIVVGRLAADRLHDVVAGIVAEQVGADAGRRRAVRSGRAGRRRW